MRKLALAAFAAALLMPATPAHAAVVATGLGCGFTATVDPLGPTGVYVGELSGGPVAGTGTLYCDVKINAYYHADPNLNGASRFASGGPVVTLPPGAVSFTVPAFANVYVCTAFHTRGTRYYWNGNAWSTWEYSSCQRATATAAAIVSAPPVVR